jgi:hypothetical protein
MNVVMKLVSGTTKANLERAKHEMERVLAFRGTVDSVKPIKNSIEVKITINPKWDLSTEQKTSYLKEWITAKTRKVFEAISISE